MTNILYINHSFFLCCRLLGEFPLPPSNILPCTYRNLYSIMKDIGMEYQYFDACPNDHIIYYRQYASEIELPQFHISRYQTDQVTKKVPHKVLHYIPIIQRLKCLLR